eukprot:m.258791 g.258791  ORF g.258791 m.258791 type:complete len:447 (+) comp37096_c0_seq1:89-1429(+)
MMASTFLLCTCALLSTLSATLAARTFHGEQVLRIVPRTDEQVSALQSIETEFPSVDFWIRPARVGANVDVRFNPNDEEDPIVKFIHATPLLNHTVMVSDIQSLIDEETAVKTQRRRQQDPWTWFYHDYDETIRHFKEDIVPDHPNIASLVTIGESFEGRELMAIRISGGDHRLRNGSAVSNDLPGFYMESLIHAREWIAGATLNWIVEYVLQNYGTDARITQLVDNHDLYFLLITNPDGVAWTHSASGDRMWRKTRSPNAGSTCVGTDPNRNWDFHWMEAGTSNNPCSDTYGGSAAATEPEVIAVQNFVRNHGNIKIFVDFHAYSQLWLTPYGWTSSLPPHLDYDAQQGMAKATSEAIEKVHGTKYTYGPISTTIYPASGSSVDYAYGVCGVKYSFGPEGRDTGRFGFLLPFTEIEPSGQENLAGVLAMADYVAMKEKEAALLSQH